MLVDHHSDHLAIFQLFIDFDAVPRQIVVKNTFLDLQGSLGGFDIVQQTISFEVSPGRNAVVKIEGENTDPYGDDKHRQHGTHH
ncbi:hypothetical protein D3C87_2000590 [compost metagenome]